jgi:hypothetical protein
MANGYYSKTGTKVGMRPGIMSHLDISMDLILLKFTGTNQLGYPISFGEAF